MKKLKYILISMVAAIAFVFMTVTGIKVTAASTQPYVNADFSTVTESDNGTNVTSNFKTAETFTFNGFTFSTTASSNNMQVNSSGLKWQKNDCSMTFTTLGISKLTIGLYVDGTDRSMGISNTNSLSITGLMKNSSVAKTTVNTTIDSSDYSYSYTVTSNTKYLTITIENCPATSFTISSEIAGKTVYVQKIIIQPYATVTYNTNGGTEIAATTTLYGDTFVPSTETTKDGYTFVAWYTNSGLTDLYDSSIAVSGDIDLYAKWADANAVYTFTFMSNGSQYGDSFSLTYDGNGEVTIGASMPTDPTPAVGYEFAGWYTKDGTNDDWGTLVTSTTIITSSMVTNKAITLYAKFDALDKYLCEFGTGTISDTKTVEFASNISIAGVIKHDNRNVISDGNSLTKYTQCTKIIFTLSSKAEVHFYMTQTNSTQYVNDVVCCITNSDESIIYDNTGFTPDYKPSAGKTINYMSVVLDAGTYVLRANGALNMYGISIDYTSTAAALNLHAVNFQWQLSDDSTKARFIGTLTGVDDLTKLDDLYVDLVLINGGKSNPYHATMNFTTVYKSVLGTGDSSKETIVDGVYYTVCTLSGLDELKTAANTKIGDTGTWTIKAKLYYTYDGVQNVVSTASVVSGF